VAPATRRALGGRYSRGGGWDGYAVASSAFHDRLPRETGTGGEG